MALKNFIQKCLEEKKASEADTFLRQLVDVYKKKLDLCNQFNAQKIDENTFKTKFVELLDIDIAFEKVEKNLIKKTNDKKLEEEFTAWWNSLIKQKEIFKEGFDYQKLSQLLKEEGNIIALESEEVKKLKESVIGRQKADAKGVKTGKIPILVYTDIGRDVDDLEALVYLAGSPHVQIVGVVTAHMIPEIRAQIARTVLDSLGLSNVAVGVGSVFPLDNQSPSLLNQYLVEHQIEGVSYEGVGMIDKGYKQPTTAGKKIILDAIETFKDQLVIAVLAPPIDIAKAILVNRESFQKIKGFYIMGQALLDKGKLVPDPKAYNFAQDMTASEILLSLQDHVPMTFVTKFAAYAVPLTREDFTQFEKTGHLVGKYLMIHALKGIECFVKRAPEIFKSVFQIPAQEEANEAFAKLEKLSNPYDVLTVMAIDRPDLFSLSSISKHIFIGSSLESTGVPNPTKTKSVLMNTILSALK